MDFDERYRAVTSRDRRFDGQFVMAVRTTGIYCRPSCPARTPKPTNVEFFPTSAAAHLAGYRACRRCLPEAMPGSPAWNLREDVAARAMRLIADGVVEREGVSGLARRLGYSERQLGRVLVAELGAGPLALARAHRAHTARQLIVSTTMRMSDLAFAAGFASIRQFNETVAEVFGMSPTQLRERSRAGGRAGHGEGLGGDVRVVLPYREPIDVRGLFGWFGTRAVDGLESVTGNSYRRSLRIGRRAAVVEIVDTGTRLEASMRVEDLADLPVVVSRVRRLLDLDADPAGADAALAADPRLAPMVAAAPGIRIPGAAGPEEAIVRALIGQQISVAAARTHLQRLVDGLGEPLPSRIARTGGDGRPEVTRLFPAPSAIAEDGADFLSGPRARIDTVVRVCEAMAAGDLELGVDDTRESLAETLRPVKGVGPWTVDYLAMRLLGHPDVLLTSDAAMRAGARRTGLGDSELAIARQVAPVAPWRSYLTMHLWRASTQKGQHP
ncbi:Ada metal-binding domain-containing protein [Brooklawnia cerclae]|uniref:DNA-3-methyladenine glycosylase II n=1 Tax=Brooklawnia cerclae TaxID=349934 RepID=A0ABX0SHP6_9ACTN|nr:AlkA N-terminal domain-containing protein [Brooklawnia cerclae]NIH57934.1 AraC family transcriptional regulator of adaptative response / DNA-3-methyladenine glycosylase II [Brooklawnia cerclae]